MKNNNLCGKQYYEKVCKYYNICILGFIIIAMVFAIIRFAGFGFFVPAIPYICAVMSLSGALGLFVDKVVWQIRNKDSND